jgi:hypothetical protein
MVAFFRCNNKFPLRYPVLKRGKMETKSGKWMGGSLLVIGVIVLAAFNVKRLDQQTVSLEDAIASGQVKMQANSLGTYSDESVLLKIQNSTPSVLKVKVKAGTMFAPADEGEQTLITIDDQFIVLQPKSANQLNLKAYCTEASDLCPSDEGAFTLASNKNAELSKLVAFVRGKSISAQCYQDAIWAVTDARPISNIQATTAVEKEMRKYIATITNKPDTWYTTPQTRVVDANRNIQQETTIVKGMITFTCDKGSVVHQELVKKNGDIMYKSDKTNTIQSGKVDFSFTVKVRGGEKGEYAVRVMAGTKELTSYPFAI